MGEYSKKIGEHGESIVKQLLALVGWSDAQSCIDIECCFPNKHKESKQPRRTHGIDYFLSMKNPLLGDVVDNIVISVKCSAAPYPSVPTQLFKHHFDELAKTMECARKSKLRQEANARQRGVTKARDIGILFWLTLDMTSYCDVVSRIIQARDITEACYDTVYVFDNERAQFLLDAHSFAERTCAGAKIEFLYPDSGQNNSPLRRQTEGRILPVEYLTSNVLPMRFVLPNGSKNLLLASRDKFSCGNVQRLLDMAHRLTQNWANDVIIAFPDYQAHLHANDVQAAKSALADVSFSSRVTIACLGNCFQGLTHE